MARTVAVVGGGVAGLVSARELARRGHHVVVLEAGDRWGGALRADDLDGIAVDVGAEGFAVTRPETRALIDDLGLRASVVAPRRSDPYLLLPEGLHPMPHAMLGVPTSLDDPAVVAVLGGDEARRAAVLDAAPMAATDPGISLGDLVRSRMGAAVVDRILVPVVGGVHAVHPDLVEAESVIPGLRASAASAGSLAGGAARLRAASGVPGAAIAGLEGGMTTLVRALVAACADAGADLRLLTPVSGIDLGADQWQVHLASEVLGVDDVVLAVDAPTAARLVPATPELTRALEDVQTGDVAVVALVLDAPALDDDPVGSGVLVAPGHPQVRAKALTHATAKWAWLRESFGPGRHLVRLSYGRDGRIQEPLDDLVAIATADAAAILGLTDPVVRDARVTRWDRSLVRPAPGHRERVARIRETAAALPGLALVGAGLGGNGLAGTIATALTATDQLEHPTPDPAR